MGFPDSSDFAVGSTGRAQLPRLHAAGKALHHAYIGGLLEHVSSLVKLADQVCDHYSWLDRDILIGGVILHDIAKTAELDVENGISYTEE